MELYWSHVEYIKLKKSKKLQILKISEESNQAAYSLLEGLAHELLECLVN